MSAPALVSCTQPFVTDVYTRKIMGWATKNRTTTKAYPYKHIDQRSLPPKAVSKIWYTTAIMAPNTSLLPTTSA